MTESIATEQVDDLIAALVDMVIEHTLQERCQQGEALKIRLALAHPSERIQELADEATELVIEALEIGVPQLLNAVLYPDD